MSSLLLSHSLDVALVKLTNATFEMEKKRAFVAAIQPYTESKIQLSEWEGVFKEMIMESTPPSPPSLFHLLSLHRLRLSITTLCKFTYRFFSSFVFFFFSFSSSLITFRKVRSNLIKIVCWWLSSSVSF